jgi:hypothetical protein
LLLKPNSQAVLAQFASTKIQFESSKTEPLASAIVLSSRQRDLSRKRVYHPGKSFAELEAGIVSRKSFAQYQLLGHLDSSARELAVHCADLKGQT